MSSRYVMCYYDVRLLRAWKDAFHGQRYGAALQIALLEENKARIRLAEGKRGASARLAAALWRRGVLPGGAPLRRGSAAY